VNSRTSDRPPLRFGVLGAARIARKFVAGLAGSQSVAAAAVASRDPVRGRAFADALGIGRVHDSYQALLDDPEIDAVYVPLPNGLHAEWSIKAARAGKHVLCEKPLAISAQQAREMFAAAEANGVYLVEGYPYRAQPQTQTLRTMLAEGVIGKVQYIQGSFGFVMSNPDDFRHEPGQGGGALMDVGLYPVSLIRIIAGAQPIRVQAAARWASGVDMTLTAMLEFDSGLLATIACSFDTVHNREALIAGEKGCIRTNFFNHPPTDEPAALWLRRGEAMGWDRIDTPGPNGFRAEAESLEAMVRLGPSAWIGASPAESIDIAVILETILQSARERRPIDLARA
jgi:xylose dehydrogenase (NAD/NADP)